MSRLNVPNRTLAIMDNLRFLRSLNNECVDLIAIDPPFAANETFTGRPRPPISDAEYAEELTLAQAHGAQHNEGRGETRVRDIWTWDADIHPAWKMQIEDDYPAVHAVIEATEACATENEAAYIAYMAVRLLECRRVLKPMGSIYLHCDDHADSYLRLLMDAVFGADNFRNEIVWRRTNSKNAVTRDFGRNHDTLLRYRKTRRAFFNRDAVRQPYDTSGGVPEGYRWDAGLQRYIALAPVHAPGTRHGDSGQPATFRGVTYVPPVNRHWVVPGGRMAGETTAQGWERLDNEGRMYLAENGRYPMSVRFLDEMMGVALDDVWVDVSIPSGVEDTGYATQKPLELYERIIAASSNPGDVVLDVFAGCATTAVAAERLGRQWLACDMAYRAWTMLKRRFYLNGIMLEGMTDSTKDALASVRKGRGFQEPTQWTTSHTIGPRELPARDDTDPAPHHRLPPTRRGAAQSTQSATWSGRIPKNEAKRLLMERFGPVCWGCGYEPRRPNGSLDETLLEVDHIRARRAAEGTSGNDELYNLALLHRTCNGIKRNRLTLEELRSHNALNGLLYVNSVSDLVDLYEATEFAAEQILRLTTEPDGPPALAGPNPSGTA